MVREIAQDPTLRGKVIPLAFHVDYWDRLGWRDAFSSPSWSRRQMYYVTAMHLSSAYTPQMVVNGSRQFVGTSRRSFENAVEEESKQAPDGSVHVNLKRTLSRIEATVSATVTTDRPTDVWLAIEQDDAVTKVEGGENAGKSIDNVAIVRQLIHVDTLRNATSEKTVNVDVDKSWGPVTVVAFLQERGTMAIRGAVTASN